MAAYFIGFAKIKDKIRMAEYSGPAAQTFAKYGGQPVARTALKMTLAGSFDADAALIVKFETAAKAKEWYDSPEYQALVPLRDQILQPTFVVLEE